MDTKWTRATRRNAVLSDFCSLAVGTLAHRLGRERDSDASSIRRRQPGEDLLTESGCIPYVGPRLIRGRSSFLLPGPSVSTDGASHDTTPTKPATMSSDANPSSHSATELDAVRAALREKLNVQGPEQEALLEYLVTGKTPKDADAQVEAVRLGIQGVSLAERGEHAEAILRYDQGLQRDPTNAALWGNKARSAEALGRFEEALGYYDRAQELDPKLGVGSHKARTLMRMKRFEEALAEFDRSLAANPEHAASWHNKGTALSFLDRREEALAAFEAALRIDPHHVAAWHNKAGVLEELGRHEEALQANTRFLEEFQPTDFGGLSKKASEALRLERPDLAIECLQRAAEIQPGNPDAWMNLGGTLFKLGRYEAAMKACDQASATGHPKASAFRELLQRCMNEGADKVLADVTGGRGSTEEPSTPSPASGSRGFWARVQRWFRG